MTNLSGVLCQKWQSNQIEQRNKRSDSPDRGSDPPLWRKQLEQRVGTGFASRPLSHFLWWRGSWNEKQNTRCVNASHMTSAIFTAFGKLLRLLLCEVCVTHVDAQFPLESGLFEPTCNDHIECQAGTGTSVLSLEKGIWNINLNIPYLSKMIQFGCQHSLVSALGAKLCSDGSWPTLESATGWREAVHWTQMPQVQYQCHIFRRGQGSKKYKEWKESKTKNAERMLSTSLKC